MSSSGDARFDVDSTCANGEEHARFRAYLCQVPQNLLRFAGFMQSLSGCCRRASAEDSAFADRRCPRSARCDTEAAEVSSPEQHQRSRSNGRVNASSSVTHECRAVLAFIAGFQ